MATIPTQIRIDEDLKKEASALFASLGLDMSGAVTIFLRQCILRRGLPFSIDMPQYDGRGAYMPSSVPAMPVGRQGLVPGAGGAVYPSGADAAGYATSGMSPAGMPLTGISSAGTSPMGIPTAGYGISGYAPAGGIEAPTTLTGKPARPKRSLINEHVSADEFLNAFPETTETVKEYIGLDTIRDIYPLKKGLTNISFIFECSGGRKYVVRIPGEGTDRIISRHEEAEIYNLLAGRGITDELIYIDPDTGVKITRYWENSRPCDYAQRQDIERCLEVLKTLHGLGLKVDHEYDIFEYARLYEDNIAGGVSMFEDHAQTKENIYSLREFLKAVDEPHVLSHIDANPDNFLFTPDASGCETIHLIDWEYSGMADPYYDVAYFCSYSPYGDEQIDEIIDIYTGGNRDKRLRAKIYAYIAINAFSFSNWYEAMYQNNKTVYAENKRLYELAKRYYERARKLM